MSNRVLLTVATVALSLPFGSHVSARQQRPELLVDVDDPRPLAAAIQRLQALYGWIITYEDPPFRHASEHVDVTTQVSRSHRTDQPPILGPRGGPLKFSFASPGPADAGVVLEALLTQYRRFGYPSDFRVLRSGAVLHVVPTRAKDARGVAVPYTPVLDMPIDIEDGERTVMEMLELITTRSNGRLGIGRVPEAYFRRAKLLGGATGIPIRVVLLQTLQATGRQFSWRVLCDPAERFPCFVNIHAVEPS